MRLWAENWIIICFVFLLFVFSASYSLWDWNYWAELTFRDGKIFETKLDKIRILQQFVFIFLGLPALCFALWRSWTAHKQANASLKQAEIAERGQNLDRFNNAAQLLDSTQLSIARAGLYSLTMLGRDAPAEYFEPAARLQLGYARDVASEMPEDKTRAGFVLALEQFSALRTSVEMHGRGDERRWNLVYVCVKDESLRYIDLRDCSFHKSEFEKCAFVVLQLGSASFSAAKLSNCRFIRCDLTEADFDFVQLTATTFNSCNISSANFARSENVTTETLGNCWAWSDALPVLPSGVKFENHFDPGAQGEVREAHMKLEKKFEAFGPPKKLT